MTDNPAIQKIRFPMENPDRIYLSVRYCLKIIHLNLPFFEFMAGLTENDPRET